jgi:hypothetical protein
MVTVDGEKIITKAIISRRWVFNNVGVYVEIPLTGIKNNHIAAKWCEYTLNKGLKSVYGMDRLGIHFNVLLRKAGVVDFDMHTPNLDPKSKSSFIFEFKSKPKVAGKFLGILMAFFFRVPVKADRSYIEDATFEDLIYYADEIVKNIKKHAKIAILSTNERGIDDKFNARFDAIMEKKKQKIHDFKKNIGKPKIPDVKEMDMGCSFKVDVGKFKNPYSLFFFGLIPDTKVQPKGDIVYLCGDELRLKDMRMNTNSESSIKRSINAYMSVGKHRSKDGKITLDKKEINHCIAVAAVAAHFPMSYAFKIASMTDIPDETAISKDLKDCIVPI